MKGKVIAFPFVGDIMIKNIIFDIGNVLVGFDWHDFYASFGYSEDVTERLARATVKDPFWNEIDRGVLSEEEILEGFIQKDPGIEQELRATYASYAELLHEFDYTKGLIKDLQAKGYKVFCLSNMSHKAVRECKALNFLPMLDGYVLSCDVKLIKPDAEIYQNLLDTFGLKPDESIFVDDLKANIDTAVELGIHGVVFKDLKSAIEEIETIIADEKEPLNQSSRYTKAQRIGALATVIFIGVCALTMLVLSFVGAEWSHKVVRGLLGAIIVLPVLAWIYIWMVGRMAHKKTIADFNFFENEK